MSRYIEIHKHFSPQLSKFLASITTASFSTRSGLRKTAYNSLFLRFTSSMNQIKPPLQPPAALLLISSRLTRRREVESMSSAPYLQELLPFLILYLKFQVDPLPIALPNSFPSTRLRAVPDAAVFLYLHSNISVLRVCVHRSWAQKPQHHTPLQAVSSSPLLKRPGIHLLEIQVINSNRQESERSRSFSSRRAEKENGGKRLSIKHT